MFAILDKSKSLLLLPAAIIAVGVQSKQELPGLIVGIIIFLLLLYVFRDEPKPTAKQPNALVSPISGYVSAITVDGSNSRIDIDQRLTDVHIHYNPGECYIKSAQWFDGQTYFGTGGDNIEKSAYYEYQCMGKIPFVVRSHPALAGRFESNITKFTTVDQLENIGYTEFGGRVSITVPSINVITVKPGDKVIGGKTPIVSLE